MAVVTSLGPLIDKLQAMLAGEESTTITHQPSAEKIHRCVSALRTLRDMLFHTTNQEIDIEELEKDRDLLGRIYDAEDCVDAFNVNVQQQLHRRREVFAGPLWFALRRASTRRQIRLVGGQMEVLAGKMEQILEALPRRSRNIDGQEPEKMPTQMASASEERLGKEENPTVASNQKQVPKQTGSMSERLDDEQDLVGRKKEEEDLTAAILRRSTLHFPITVVGPGGSGKTTLVRRVYNNKEVAESFQLRVWIVLETEFVEKDVLVKLVEILKQMAFLKDVDERLPPEKLQERVSDVLMRKRYLVVLDYVKKAADWNRLKAVFSNSLNGSKVILTFRDKGEAQVITSPGVYQVELKDLNDEDSWALFMKKARKEEDGLIAAELKAKILEKCHGLPLALIILAGLLSSKAVEDWSKVVDVATFQEGSSQSIVSLAYWELPATLKSCLLYLGIFPKEYVIPTRRLLHLWAAEGFGDYHSDDKLTPEEAVESSFKQLVQRNMIEVERWRLDGSPRTCRAPGILHDNIFSNAVEAGFYHCHRKHNDNKSDDSSAPQTVRRVAEYVDSSDYDVDHLRSYVCFNTKKGDMPTKEVGEFISRVINNKGFGLLRVLDLENIYKPVLPEDIGKLLLLKYLGLRWTFLDSIPNSVGNLPSLETLDLKHTNIMSLPISIWDSEKLRHLYLNEIHLDKSAQSKQLLAQGSLTNLLTLWGLMIGKTVPSMEWLNRLKSLTRLGLTCHSRSLSEISGWISQCTRLKSLKLRSIDRFSRPSDLALPDISCHDKLSDLYLLGKLPEETNMGTLPQSLKILTLSLSKLKNDPMETLGQLPQLNILRLFGQSYLGKEMTCHPKGFPKLRVLKLWVLEELDKLTVCEGSMPALREMEIRRCMKLRETQGLQNLTMLKELILTNMPPSFISETRRSMRERQMKEGSKVIVTVNDWDFMPLPQES
ncbi:unnamed protein product [Linum tenue]|uniref:NB-ARC domain-containing protein n=1 Tax=Linum tenue TaxID=586396 RepID=A0AAV0PEF0_9ROSI|nr:unnamed protein product [Linum tenue]